MDTPQHKSPGQDAVEPEPEETVPDLEASGRDADEVVGGFRAIRNTTRGFPSEAPPTEPEQPAQ